MSLRYILAKNESLIRGGARDRSQERRAVDDLAYNRVLRERRGYGMGYEPNFNRMSRNRFEKFRWESPVQQEMIDGRLRNRVDEQTGDIVPRVLFRRNRMASQIALARMWQNRGTNNLGSLNEDVYGRIFSYL